MSDEAAKRFLEMLAGDKDLDRRCQQACEEAGSPEAAFGIMVELATRHGLSFTADELVGRVEAHRHEPAELSDDELDAVAGGGLVIEDRPSPVGSRTLRALGSGPTALPGFGGLVGS